MFEETKPWPDPVGICRNLIFQSFSNSILDPCSINGWSTTQQVHWVWSATPQAVSLVCWMRSRSWLFGSIGMMGFFSHFSYVEMAHQYGPFSSMIYLYYSVLSILLGWFSIGFNYPKVKRNSEGIWKAWFYCRASLTGDAVKFGHQSALQHHQHPQSNMPTAASGIFPWTLSPPKGSV